MKSLCVLAFTIASLQLSACGNSEHEVEFLLDQAGEHEQALVEAEPLPPQDGGPPSLSHTWHDDTGVSCIDCHSRGSPGPPPKPLPPPDSVWKCFECHTVEHLMPHLPDHPSDEHLACTDCHVGPDGYWR